MKSERELLKSKIAGLNDQIAVKDNQISNYHDKLDEQNSTNAAHKDIELMMQ